MRLFKEIVEGKVYRLEFPSPVLGSPVTLVTTGNQNFLIDCGKNDAAVVNYLIPALKKRKLSLSKINFLLFTHCHQENTGGVHKIRELAPNIRIVVTSTQADILKNPMYYLVKRWSRFTDWAPPFKEVRGFIASNTACEINKEFDGIVPILTPGHDEDCVCWHILDGDIVVCGDALQGNGTEEAKIAYYSDAEEYCNSLEIIENLTVTGDGGKIKYRSPKMLLCNVGISGVSGVIEGEKECREAIRVCEKAVSDNAKFLKNYMQAHGINEEMIDYHALVTEYFTKENRPEHLGYAMMTFKAHTSNK